jgi:hypothetical protein
VKSLKTTENAINSLETQTTEQQKLLEITNTEISLTKKSADSYDGTSDLTKDNSRLKQTINEIKSLNANKNMLEKELIHSNEYVLELNKLYEIEADYERVKLEHDQLAINLRNDMVNIVNSFSKKYAGFLRNFDQTFLHAKIDEEYEPIINNYQYINAALRSPKRFYYYLTLLALGIDINTPYPRFLMIDTPQNFGLDSDKTTHLINSLGIFQQENDEQDYQIFLTINKDFVSDNMRKFVRYDIPDKILVRSQD